LHPKWVGKFKAKYRLRTTALNLISSVNQSDHRKEKVTGIYRVKGEVISCFSLENTREAGQLLPAEH